MENMKKLFLALAILLLCSPAYSQPRGGDPGTKWFEVDGSPQGRPRTIVTPNDVITFNGNIMSVDIMSIMSADNTFYTQTELGSVVDGSEGSKLIGYKDNETLKEILDDVINQGVLDSDGVNATGGLNISWTGVEIYTPDGDIIEITDGSLTCVNSAINHLIWRTGTTLQLIQSDPLLTDVLVGHMSCEDNVIWELHDEVISSTRVRDIQHGLEEFFPVAISPTKGGLAVTNAVGGSALDVVMSAGEFYHDLHEEHDVPQINSTATNMVRWYQDGTTAWVNTVSADIDTAQRNSGTGLENIPNNQYVLSAFKTSTTQIHWIYSDTDYPNSQQALAAALAGVMPDSPPGIANFPWTSFLIYKQGDTNLTSNATFGIILANRPDGVMGALPSNDHATLTNLAWSVAGHDPLDTDLAMGDNSITGVNSILAGTDTSGVLTLGGVGGSNNENITLDGESVANSLLFSTSSGVTGTDWNADFFVGGRFGEGSRTLPAAGTNHRIRAYSNDTSQNNDFIEMSHDQTDGRIVTGEGDIVLMPATGNVGVGGVPGRDFSLIGSGTTFFQITNAALGVGSGNGFEIFVTDAGGGGIINRESGALELRSGGAISINANGGGLNLNASNGQFVFKDNGTTSGFFTFDITQTQVNFSVRDAAGNMLIFTDDANSGVQHDHATPTDFHMFIHSALSPAVSNNQWGSLHHDQENFIITSGVEVGDGSGDLPTRTIENAIVFAPRGVEVARIDSTEFNVTGDIKATGTLTIGSTTLTEQNLIDLLNLI